MTRRLCWHELRALLTALPNERYNVLACIIVGMVSHC
jgi:hypothetical protein